MSFHPPESVGSLELEEGEYLMYPNDVKYNPETHVYLPETIVARLRGQNMMTYTLVKNNKVDAGGLGSVFRYDSEKNESSLALKQTNIFTTDDSGPNHSHHVTESRAPRRLLETASPCRDFFIETLIPHARSVNAIAYDDEDPEFSYTLGEENPTDIWYERNKPHVVETPRLDTPRLDTPRLNNFGKVWINISLFTVMHRAHDSLYAREIQYTDLETVLAFVDSAQKCLREAGYYYKDFKLDQILVLEDRTLRLGDLGNLCQTNDSCEFGFFDDPELWSLNTLGKWRETKGDIGQGYGSLSVTEISRALEWQRTVFVCELVCAASNTLGSRKESQVYKLSPHSWGNSTASQVAKLFDAMLLILKSSPIFKEHPCVVKAAAQLIVKKDWVVREEHSL